jgi:hypothetical protein
MALKSCTMQIVEYKLLSFWCHINDIGQPFFSKQSIIISAMASRDKMTTATEMLSALLLLLLVSTIVLPPPAAGARPDHTDWPPSPPAPSINFELHGRSADGTGSRPHTKVPSGVPSPLPENLVELFFFAPSGSSNGSNHHGTHSRLPDAPAAQG